MSDAQTALAQVREALEAMRGDWLGDGFTKLRRSQIVAVLNEQAAEIERLTKACRRAVIALAAATDQMPVFAADYAAVSDALKEQR